MQFVTKYSARIIFTIAVATISLAFAEGLAQLVGRSFVYQLYSPGRLLELAATLLVFVIVIQLGQIRDELRRR